MARLRGAPTTQNAPPAQATRLPLKETTNTSQIKTPVYENDGNANELVKNARPGRGRSEKAAYNEHELVMAGGLGEVESERQTLLPADEPVATDELAKSDGPPPEQAAKGNRRPPRMARKAVQTEANSQVAQDMKKRFVATTRKDATSRGIASDQPSKRLATGLTTLPTKPPNARHSRSSNVDRSDFSLSPSPPPPGKPSAGKNHHTALAQQDTTTKTQPTLAVEHSFSALKNFKRRPRQPSMLQMVQHRTASARPSAINMQAAEDRTNLDLQDDIEDEEDFIPDAEGTPLRPRKAQNPRLSVAKSTSKSRPDPIVSSTPSTETKKRKSDVADLASSALSVLKAKRRKSSTPPEEENHDQALLTSVPDPAEAPMVSDTALLSSAGAQHPPPARQTALPAQRESYVQVVASQASSTPPTEPSSDAGLVNDEDEFAVPLTARNILQNERTTGMNDLEDNEVNDMLDGTLAEPASSSPLPSPRQVQPQPDTAAAPTTQVSPRARRDKTKTKAKPMTTAMLTSLLPKRRPPPKSRHRNTEYDIDSDSDGNLPIDSNDIEEREDQEGGTSRRKTRLAPMKSKKALTGTTAKSLQNKATLPTRKSSAPPPRKPAAPQRPARKASKTYGTRATNTTSDKENEDATAAGFESLDENDESALPDTSLSMYEAAQSKELEAARRKFAEVDEWDMEFESMSVEEGRSSSQEWR